MKLNLGCGYDKKIGGDWINIDINPMFIPDVIHDLSKPLEYKDGSIEHIRAKDILEHFNKYKIQHIFKHWVSLLKKDGIMEVTTPNIEAILGFRGNVPLMLDLIFGEPFFMGVDTGDYGVHKYSFSKNTLAKLFTDNGLNVENIESVDGTNLYCLGRKL